MSIYTKYKGYTRQLGYIFLFATILVLVGLHQISILENAVAINVMSNTTMSSERANITAQAPVNEKTGQTVLPPDNTLLERDTITEQPIIESGLELNSIVRNSLIGSNLLDASNFNRDGTGIELDDIELGDNVNSNRLIENLLETNRALGLNFNPRNDITKENLRDLLAGSITNRLLSNEIAAEPDLIDSNLLLNLADNDSKTISSILNDTNEIIDWVPFESIIAVKVTNEDPKIKNADISVHAFFDNKYQLISYWNENDFNLYKFVHFSGAKWEHPAVPINVKAFIPTPNVQSPNNITESSMCSTYLEIGKLYKCYITIK